MKKPPSGGFFGWWISPQGLAGGVSAFFFAASVDGGVTFLPEAKVATKPTCPGTPPNVATALRFPRWWGYVGLASAPDGSFRLVWSDSRSEICRLYSATVSVRAAAGQGSFGRVP